MGIKVVLRGRSLFLECTVYRDTERLNVAFTSVRGGQRRGGGGIGHEAIPHEVFNPDVLATWRCKTCVRCGKGVARAGPLTGEPFPFLLTVFSLEPFVRATAPLTSDSTRRCFGAARSGPSAVRLGNHVGRRQFRSSSFWLECCCGAVDR